MFEKRSVTHFMGMIERREFSQNYERFGKNIGSLEYFNNHFPFSKIVYVSDQTKFIKNMYPNYDTLVSIKGSVDVDTKNTKVIYKSDSQSESDFIEFRTRKL